MDAPSPTAEYEDYGRFIPLTRQAVVADLCKDPADKLEDVETFARLAVKLHAWRARQYRAVAEEMRRCYLPFSPDRDTLSVLPFSADEQERMEADLMRRVTSLLDRANYTALAEVDINAIINLHQPFSLKVSVDLSEYERFSLHFRDPYTERHTYRRPEWGYLRKATVEVRSFRRLYLLLKLHPEETQIAHLMAAKKLSRARARRIVRRKRRYLPQGTSPDFIYMKMFKDIPEHDVQLLFPNRQVQFRPFDRVKFLVTAGGGTAFGLFTTFGKVAAATGPFALAGAMAGFLAIVGRQVVSFFNHRTRYMMELSQKLFFHSLATNRAALTLLLDRAEEEDVKEDLITLYALGGQEVAEDALAAHKARIEARIRSRYCAIVDFDLEDCVKRLWRDGLLRRPAPGVLSFAPPGEAYAHYARLLAEAEEIDADHVCDPPPPEALHEG